MNKLEKEQFIIRISECNLSDNDKYELVDIVNNDKLSSLEKLLRVGEIFGLSLELLEFIRQFLE